VVAVFDVLGVPAIRFEPLVNVFGERTGCITVLLAVRIVSYMA
jgi:hypothetical protein